MKTMKMNLDNMQGKLSRAEMKNVVGGEDNTKPSFIILTDFYCSCNSGGTNVPYRSSWTGTYGSQDEIRRDIDRICTSGGTCTQV